MKTALETLNRDIEVNASEVEEEIHQKKQELEVAYAMVAFSENRDQTQIHRINQEIAVLHSKLTDLKAALSRMETVIRNFNYTNNAFTDMLKKVSPSKGILRTFETLAHQYRQMNSGSGNYMPVRGHSSSTANQQSGSFADVRELGDTYHYSKKNQLSQYDINQLEGELKSPSYKGNKISIDNVSQSDFDLLEKNGYTINKVGPNDYSAFKEIER
jgi:hypothetical protein